MELAIRGYKEPSGAEEPLKVPNKRVGEKALDFLFQTLKELENCCCPRML